MPHDSQDIAGRLTSTGLVARSLLLFSRGAANVSLPGFTELEDMVKELVENWKAADHNGNEFVRLATRLEGLCSLIHELDMAEHPDISNASRKFHEFKSSLAEEFKPWPRSGMRSAEQKQRLLDNLSREIDRVVEMTLLRLALVQARSSERNPIDNFQVISAHQITDQIPVYHTLYPDPLVISIKNSWPLPSNRPVMVSSRQARLGRASVMYKTFRSPSDSGLAAKVAEAELKHISRCLHPNVTSVIGVTKGYDGLNGYIVAADGMPLDQFFFRVNSGAALVKLIRGIEDLLANTMDNLTYLIDPAHITVKYNGQPTVFPVLSQTRGWTVGGYLSLSKEDRAVLNPAVRVFITIYQNYNQRSPYWDPIYAGFFDSIMMSGWKPLTRLDIARLAAKYKLLPDRYHRDWQGLDIPPYTISVGDIGYNTPNGQDQQDAWSPIELKQVSGIEWSYRCDCGHAEGGRTRTEGDQWTSIALHICGHSRFRWWQEESNETSYEQAKQARASLCRDGVQVKGVQYCTGVSCSLTIDRIGSTERSFRQLYFHCNPSMRSNHQAFWGFLSTSADPCTPPLVLEEIELEVTYRFWYETYCLSDFWDYKYEEMLQSGLASIPGSYPGSYVEEVSEDEATEDGSCLSPP